VTEAQRRKDGALKPDCGRQKSRYSVETAAQNLATSEAAMAPRGNLELENPPCIKERRVQSGVWLLLDVGALSAEASLCAEGWRQQDL